MLWLEPEVKQWIEERDWTRLREVLRNRPLPEVADLLQGLGKIDRTLLFRALPRETSTEVFAYLDGEEENALLTDLTDEETRELLSRLRPDDRTNLFEELPGQATQKLLNLLSPEDLREARWLLGYPEESVC
ncbi:MAG: magnesium transporter MgtE N-terminal domain-containing protein [Pyrinomonadaceae bacterium]